jgi:predicted DNA-binding WGR domain protein
MTYTAVSLPNSPADVGEPIERRMFQLTDLRDNHNKFYMVELWISSDGSSEQVRFRATWGRVGARPQVSEKVVSRREVERHVKEKLQKGYRPVAIHRPERTESGTEDDEAVPPLDAKVVQLVDWIFAEAGEHIRSYLAVPVEALGQAQVDEGRRLLALAQELDARYRRNPLRPKRTLAALTEAVEAYYNAIPTKLPAKMDIEQIVLEFGKQLSDQEDRLSQLEAAIATSNAQRQQPSLSQYATLGAEITPLPTEDETYQAIAAYITGTQVHGYRLAIRDIFDVCIPAEREAYQQNDRGIERRELLFHGTRNRNIRHILRSGLICPKTPSNGRMLGNGIYLANRASKSTNYCSTSAPNVPRMLLVVEAALGNAYVAPHASGIGGPPSGYDSVWGKAGHTSIAGVYTLMNDEFVVYSACQQTVRYLVTFDQC